MLSWLDRAGKDGQKFSSNLRGGSKISNFQVELNFLSPLAAIQGGDSTAYEGVRLWGRRRVVFGP